VRASSKKLIAKFLSTFLFTLAILLTGLGFIPTAFAVDAATVTVPGTVQVQANSATTNITGVSISGLSGTILVAIGLTNFPVNAVLKLPTTTGLTASYGFTTAPNTFASFTNISFTGNISDVNTALASMQYVSGASGTSNPTIKVTATTSTTGYALNGYNGHFYKSSNPSTNTYTGARTAAMATTYKGMPGYLVTITSAGENTFVAQNIERAISVWIGATDELSEGVWKWEYEKGDDGKFIAKYGYYGKNPWWKIIAGGAIAIIIGAVTLGYVIWSPWGMDATLFHSLEVDLEKSTVQPKISK